uniref:Uncharacterized protein n=1 Tax=Arundo donax TaxID=35708 RepID=A0A0A8YAZ0_ARUDO
MARPQLQKLARESELARGHQLLKCNKSLDVLGSCRGILITTFSVPKLCTEVNYASLTLSLSLGQLRISLSLCARWFDHDLHGEIFRAAAMKGFRWMDI